MCWVALDRAAKLAEIRGDPELQAQWGATAEEIRADILEHGVDERGVLRQHYATDALDASTLLAAIFGFLPPTTSGCARACSRSTDELTEHGFVLRYRTDETDDGLSGKEGTFLICSFWLVSALAIVGELQRARDLMERLLRDASPLGLYAEEFDADTGRHLGNFPQAFSHLALIEAAARIIVAERLERTAHERLRRDRDRQRRGRRHARHRLAPSGKRILLLERGDWLPREPQNWSARDVFVDNRYVSPGHLVRRRRQAVPAAGPLLRRRRDEALRRRALPPARGGLRRAAHHDGVSPAWPIGYDEMEPYYTQAEQLYQVHGARGEDPTEPPASAPYPFPAVSHEPRIQQLSDDLAAAGLPPVPRAVRRHARRGEHALQRVRALRDCDGFPCLVHAKSDAEVLGVRPALEHPNVTLLTNAEAVRLETNAAATTVTGVVVDRRRGHETFRGDLVVVSCGAANSAQLLLASANDRARDGLANGSDQVGRNYMFHNSQAVLALSKDENPTVFQKTLGLNDFYFGDRDADYPLGNIQMVGKS